VTRGRFSGNVLGTDSPRLMADSNEPKKETVGIAVPSPPPKPPGEGKESRDAVRINLPVHPPSTVPTPPAMLPDSAKAVKAPQFFPASPPSPASSPKPPTASHSTASSFAASSPGPKKETTRIAVLPGPRPKASPVLQMMKTQPLITMPEITPQSAPLTVATKDTSAIVDAIPMPLCWTPLGVSTVILIIQIWTYFS
jgi:hypothetical protein